MYPSRLGHRTRVVGISLIPILSLGKAHHYSLVQKPPLRVCRAPKHLGGMFLIEKISTWTEISELRLNQRLSRPSQSHASSGTPSLI